MNTCGLCGDANYGPRVLHTCCWFAVIDGYDRCPACDNARRNGPGEPRELQGEPIPVEEWDWPELRRLDRNAKARMARLPKCTDCGAPMVLEQVGLHHICRRST